MERRIEELDDEEFINAASARVRGVFANKPKLNWLAEQFESVKDKERTSPGWRYNVMRIYPGENIPPLTYNEENDNFRVANIFLDAAIEHGDSEVEALRQTLKEHKEVPDWFFKSFFDKMKNSTSNIGTKINALVQSKCPLNRIVLLDDHAVTQGILDQNIPIDKSEFLNSLRYVIANNDRRQIDVLLNSGYKVQSRKATFLGEIERCFDMLYPQVLETFKINGDCTIEETRPIDVLKEKFDVDDIIELFQLFTDLKGMNSVFPKNVYWPDLVRRLLNTPIRKMAEKVLEANVYFHDDLECAFLMMIRHFQKDLRTIIFKFFLEIGGIDIGIVRGLIILYPHFNNGEYTRILLQYGVDVQDYIIADLQAYKNLCPLIKLKLAHLALINGQEIHIKPEILSKIDSVERFQIFYERCCDDIDRMKARKISEDATILDLLAKKPEEIIKYVPNQETVDEILDYLRRYNVDRYYYSMLERNLNEAMMLNQLHFKTVVLLCQASRICDTTHLVIESIMDLVSTKDVVRFWMRDQ